MENETKAFAALGATASAYAAALNTAPGKKFAKEYTWASVVIGTSLVLAFLRLVLPKESWLKVAAAFGIAGAPMIGRSLVNKYLSN